MGYTVGGPPSNLLSTPRILTTLLHNLLVLLAWVKFMRQSQFSSQSKKFVQEIVLQNYLDSIALSMSKFVLFFLSLKDKDKL